MHNKTQGDFFTLKMLYNYLFILDMDQKIFLFFVFLQFPGPPACAEDDGGEKAEHDEKNTVILGLDPGIQKIRTNSFL